MKTIDVVLVAGVLVVGGVAAFMLLRPPPPPPVPAYVPPPPPAPLPQPGCKGLECLGETVGGVVNGVAKIFTLF